MKRCMLMSVLSLLFSLLLPVTVQHAAGISGGEALPEVSPAASAAPESAADAFSGFDALTGVTLLRGGEVHTERMAKVLMDEFRSGKLGKFTLEMPEDVR